MRLSCRRAARIIAVSENTRADVLRLYGVPGERVEVVPHGVDARVATWERTVGGSMIKRVSMVRFKDDVPLEEAQRLWSQVAWVSLRHRWHPRVKLAPSKSEARRLVQSGGVYVNNRRISDPSHRVTLAHAISGEVLILRRGARQQHVIRIS